MYSMDKLCFVERKIFTRALGYQRKCYCELRWHKFEIHQPGPIVQWGDQGSKRLSAEPGQTYTITKKKMKAKPGTGTSPPPSHLFRGRGWVLWVQDPLTETEKEEVKGMSKWQVRDTRTVVLATWRVFLHPGQHCGLPEAPDKSPAPAVAPRVLLA